MEIEWSDWQDLTAETAKSVPESAVFAVYEIRLADGHGEPVPFKRRLGIDTDGITYIGASGVLRADGPQLRKRFVLHRAAHANGKRGGADDEDLNVLWRKITGKYGQGAWLQFRYTIVSSKLEAKRIEAFLQAQHQARFGEKHDYLWKNQAHPLFP